MHTDTKISRNRGQFIAELFAKAQDCTMFTDSAAGHPRPIQAAQDALAQFGFARLWSLGEGRYTVIVHNNLTYDFTVEGE